MYVMYSRSSIFGMTRSRKNIPVPITNHLIIDLAELKYSPQIVECTWLSEKVEMVRTSTENNISVTDFLEKNMQ